ncbi:STAS domain-containing protein [Sphingobium sp. H33]|uniref:STAS domain-containing protein n=2 Tax=Sphingobium nicotianae TaxID=2782607 RepID=A0A9X1DC46_9SPHN|nr:SulP family inorganic anion transporter [Sphingobium nicotianae]MBT2187204.1 STAS domain-containing protein [Sphingobium nicotianae]
MKSWDFMAGLSVAGLMLPEAIGYAGIAGLPAQHAILAACAGACAYTILGRSRFAIVAPTSSSAAILAATLATLPLGATGRAMAAALVVALVGIIFGVMALARLGGLASFISRPVLRGFALGLAITIIIKQLPVVIGLPLHAGNIGELLAAIFVSFRQWHWMSVLTALIALAFLFGLRRFPSMPGVLLVLAGSIVGSSIFDLRGHGVASVGMIDLMPQWDHIQWPSSRELLLLPQLALPIVLILFAESWGTMRTLALRHGDLINPNRELGALGLSNLASAFVMGMPVGAGFSAGSAAEAAGASSRWTGLIAAAGLGALILVAMPLVAGLPEPVLAAIVIAALVHALDPAPFERLWKVRRDLGVAVGAAAGVLILGVLDGMLFAIALSLAVLIRRLAAPHLSELGRLGTSRDYVDIAYHPDAVLPADMAIYRPAEPLFFANAERVLGRIAAMQAAQPDRERMVLSLEQSFDLDSTALDALAEFSQLMQQRHVVLKLARVRDHIRALMRQAEMPDLLARSSYSVDDAVQSFALRQE